MDWKEYGTKRKWLTWDFYFDGMKKIHEDHRSG
jgi:hypothetical protein